MGARLESLPPAPLRSPLKPLNNEYQHPTLHRIKEHICRVKGQNETATGFRLTKDIIVVLNPFDNDGTINIIDSNNKTRPAARQIDSEPTLVTQRTNRTVSYKVGIAGDPIQSHLLYYDEKGRFQSKPLTPSEVPANEYGVHISLYPNSEFFVTALYRSGNTCLKGAKLKQFIENIEKKNTPHKPPPHHVTFNLANLQTTQS